jgi:hypothetical protein
LPLRQLDLLLGVPIADAVDACLVVHVCHHLLAHLISDEVAFRLAIFTRREVVLQART